MRMSQLLMAVVLVSSTSLVFADNAKGKNARPDPQEHAVRVGNEKAATSGSNAENKTVRARERHGEKSEGERTHDLTVGNEKAADHGSKADAKSAKQRKEHADKGKHKAKGHDKKMNETED